MSHEGSCSIASIVLLYKTYSRVHKQQNYNTQEIFPIWWHALQMCFTIRAEMQRTRENTKKKQYSKAEINKTNYRVKHTCPLANTIAINAAASMTHDNGFHIKPRNLRNLFSCTTT
jgi:hypothetical protein